MEEFLKNRNVQITNYCMEKYIISCLFDFVNEYENTQYIIEEEANNPIFYHVLNKILSENNKTAYINSKRKNMIETILNGITNNLDPKKDRNWILLANNSKFETMKCQPIEGVKLYINESKKRDFPKSFVRILKRQSGEKYIVIKSLIDVLLVNDVKFLEKTLIGTDEEIKELFSDANAKGLYPWFVNTLIEEFPFIYKSEYVERIENINEIYNGEEEKGFVLEINHRKW